jgi:hypothetical protein
MTTIVLVGSPGTKGEEYRFARGRLRSLGADALAADLLHELIAGDSRP